MGAVRNFNTYKMMHKAHISATDISITSNIYHFCALVIVQILYSSYYEVCNLLLLIITILLYYRILEVILPNCTSIHMKHLVSIPSLSQALSRFCWPLFSSIKSLNLYPISTIWHSTWPTLHSHYSININEMNMYLFIPYQIHPRWVIFLNKLSFA